MPSPTLTRERSGCGLDDYSQLRCSCGWESNRFYEWQDDMSTRLSESERAHRVVCPCEYRNLGGI